MGKRYEIWDRTTEILTPGMNDQIKSGFTYSTPIGTQRFTPEEWMMIHAAPPNAVILCAHGDYNGGYFGTLGELVRLYEARGLDFSSANTNEEKLDLIEEFEDKIIQESINQVSPETRIAAALELSNLMKLEDEQIDDPD